MLYSISFSLSVWILGTAEVEITRGSPPGSTTVVQRVRFPSAENLVRFGRILQGLACHPYFLSLDLT
jgi:hypothetical protein